MSAVGVMLATGENRREFGASCWSQTSDEAVTTVQQVRASSSVALGSMDLRRIDSY